MGFFLVETFAAGGRHMHVCAEKRAPATRKLSRRAGTGAGRKGGADSLPPSTLR